MRLKTLYKSVFTKQRVRSLASGCLLLFLALVCHFYSSRYSAQNAQQFVGDLFLDNLPTLGLNPLIVEGAILAILISLLLVFLKPSHIIFTVKAVAVFIAVRAFFVSVTHLGIYPSQIGPDGGFIDRIYSYLGLQTGYFFSAHTGLPFLMALIFWDDKFWRYSYLALSAVFGAAVLLAHVHYSIDVFAAPFMTYSIFKLTAYLFAEDYGIISERGGP